MNKSILVIDTPKNCDECPLMQSYYDHDYGLIKKCIGSGVNDCIVFKRKLEDYCPLKPMPKRMLTLAKINNGEILNNNEIQYMKGRNDCIDEIQGEER